jgi:hypothetical protein
LCFSIPTRLYVLQGGSTAGPSHYRKSTKPHSITPSAVTSSFRHGQAKRLGGHQLELGRRMYRQLSRFLSLEDVIDVSSHAPARVDRSGPVGNQAAADDEAAVTGQRV